MTTATTGADSASADEQAYRDHERPVLAMLSTRYRDLDPDGRRELYHEAWASVLKRRSEGVEVEALRAYLMGAADKLAAKRVYGADARRRHTFDPDASSFGTLADLGEQPDEAAMAADEARRLHLLVEELDQAERDLLKLRLDLGLEPAEIRERLGLSDRQYRRTAERAGKSLLAQFRAFDRGDWARHKRSLLCACVMGVASEAQRQRAERLIEEDPCCRAMMGELRALGSNAAALLPLPATTAVGVDQGGVGVRAVELVADAKARLADLAARALDGGEGARERTVSTLSSARRQAGETVLGAKQHASSLYVRAADPTPLAGARPGAAAAIVASCIAAGGGAYCAVEGVPESLRVPVGMEQPEAETTPEKPDADRPSNAQASPTPAPPVLPSEPPAQGQPTPTPTPPAVAPTPTPAPAPPPPAPEGEFEPAGSGAGPDLSAPSAPAVRRPAAPEPAQGGGGEFSP